MTDITLARRGERRFAHRLRVRLASLVRRRAAAADFDHLSDHMLRDIGVQRDPLDQLAIRTLHDALRFSS